MLKEALSFQHELGKQACDVKLVDLPENQVLLVKPGGETQVMSKGNAQRKDVVATLGSLIDWCMTNGAEDSLDVWVSTANVEAVNDFEHPDHTDRVKLPLVASKAWESLVQWNGSGRKQKDTVRLLRGQLAGTFDELHLRVFKNLDFTRRSDGNRSVTHKSESLGRSVELAAQSRDGDIPEVIVFQVPRFDYEGSPTVHVKMAVEVDAEADLISLFVIGDAFVQGTRAALREIAGDIKNAVDYAEVYQS